MRISFDSVNVNNTTVFVADAAVRLHSSTTTTLPRRSRKTTTTDSSRCVRTHTAMTSSILDDDDEDVQNANTPDELTSSSSVIRLPQLHQHQQHHQQEIIDRPTQIGKSVYLSDRIASSYNSNNNYVPAPVSSYSALQCGRHPGHLCPHNR